MAKSLSQMLSKCITARRRNPEILYTQKIGISVIGLVIATLVLFGAGII